MKTKTTTPERIMVSLTTLEMDTLRQLAHEYGASVSWVIRQIIIGKLSALKILEA